MNKNPYRHDGRADKDSYGHDRRADSHCLFPWHYFGTLYAVKTFEKKDACLSGCMYCITTVWDIFFLGRSVSILSEHVKCFLFSIYILKYF